MPRIQRLTRNQVSEASGAIYDRYLRERGNVPNFFRTMANRPEIFETMIAHFEAILTTGTLTTKLKELVIVRTSQLNHCEYCLDSHTKLARKLGWSADQITALSDPENSELFTPAEKAALHLAEKMTLDSNHYTDAEFATLRTFYSEGEIIELMTSIGIFNYFNRFNNVLRMEPTRPLTAEEIATGGFALRT
ncbi:MAG TPA: carboxymuconolactone decarboxylase family protein [Acidobacteriaceae bacterium]